MLPLAEQYDLAIAGGDTNSWDGPLVISITLAGPGHRPRAALPRRRPAGRPDPGHRVLRRQHPGPAFDFEPRVHEALLLNERYELHAGIDVSDGLALDLAQLVRGKRRGRGRRDGRVPIPDDARRLAGQRRRRPHAAGPCPGRRRGFRVDAGRAARRSPADAGRAAAGRAADATSASSSPSRACGSARRTARCGR